MTPEELCAPYVSITYTTNDFGEPDGGLGEREEVLRCRCMPHGHELLWPHEGMVVAA